MSSMQVSSGDGEAAPTGRWRNGLCDCCETVCTGRFGMGLCLNWVLLGQVMQRFRLNLLGQPGGEQKYVCMIFSIAITVLIVLVISIPHAAVTSICKYCTHNYSILRGCCASCLDSSLVRSLHHSPGVALGCRNVHTFPSASKVPNSRKYLRGRIFGRLLLHVLVCLLHRHSTESSFAR